MNPTMTPDQKFKAAYAAALRTHGSHAAIPKEEQQLMGERLRADYIVERYGLDPEVLAQHSVAGRIIEELCGQIPTKERKVRMVDKRKMVQDWITDNPGVTVTPQTIAEIGDFSYSTAMAYINERVDVFVKVKRGFYLVRDVDAERQKDKA